MTTPSLSTLYAYGKDVDRFEAWVHHTHPRADGSKPSVHDVHMVDYFRLHSLTHAKSTLNRWLIAIRRMYPMMQMYHEVRAIIKQMPKKQKSIKYLTDEQFEAIYRTFGTNLVDSRDLAFMCLVREGYTRRQLTGVTVGDLKRKNLHMGTSDALALWYIHSGINYGLVLRAITRYGKVKSKIGEHGLCDLAKRLVAKIGLNPKDYSTLSFRRPK